MNATFAMPYLQVCCLGGLGQSMADGKAEARKYDIAPGDIDQDAD